MGYGHRNTVTPEEVAGVLKEIREFIATPQFQRVLLELRGLRATKRATFVRDVVTNSLRLAERGIQVPAGMTVQRSLFMDGRPSLFCVTKYLSDTKRKVTITFDEAAGG